MHRITGLSGVYRLAGSDRLPRLSWILLRIRGLGILLWILLRILLRILRLWSGLVLGSRWLFLTRRHDAIARPSQRHVQSWIDRLSILIDGGARLRPRGGLGSSGLRAGRR